MSILPLACASQTLKVSCPLLCIYHPDDKFPLSQQRERARTRTQSFNGVTNFFQPLRTTSSSGFVSLAEGRSSAALIQLSNLHTQASGVLSVAVPSVHPRFWCLPYWCEDARCLAPFAGKPAACRLMVPLHHPTAHKVQPPPLAIDREPACTSKQAGQRPQHRDRSSTGGSPHLLRLCSLRISQRSIPRKCGSATRARCRKPVDSTSARLYWLPRK